MPEVENGYRLAARMMVVGLDPDALAALIRADRRAVTLAVLDELEARSAPSPERHPFRVVMDEMRARLA